MMLKRLAKEWMNAQTLPPSPPLLILKPKSDENLMEWIAVILGEAGTPYEGGQFWLNITIPDSYPIQPPIIQFTTRICHPNVHFKTGEICLDVLKSAWSPTWTLQSACMAISLLLTTPEPSSPLNCDAANLLRCNDHMGYFSLVQMYTKIYASSSPPQNS